MKKMFKYGDVRISLISVLDATLDYVFREVELIALARE